jgi:hypothetical protein
MSIVAESAKIAVYNPTLIPIAGKNQPLQSDINGNANLNIAAMTAAFTTYSVSALGGGATFTVPAGKKWIVKSVYLTLVTNATVGNRRASIFVQSGAGLLISIGSAAMTQAASLTQTYVFSNGTGSVATLVTTQAFCTFPEVVMSAGMRLVDNTGGEQGTDSVTMVINVIELPA